MLCLKWGRKKELNAGAYAIVVTRKPRPWHQSEILLKAMKTILNVLLNVFGEYNMQYFVRREDMAKPQVSSIDLKVVFLSEPHNPCCTPGFTSGKLQRGRL